MSSVDAPTWVSLSDEQLLRMRICDLGLRIEGTDLEERVTTLYRELEEKGLHVRPQVYLGDEWFSPEGMLAIAIPFYLAHPRLKALEQNMMLEVEGGSPEYFMKLLRHEAGHCFDHAYRFSKRKRWHEVFGDPRIEYSPETYHPKPYSRSFVQHLENWYAQAHPDEDFAESFAVWLTPGMDWKKTYRSWPGALQKLSYVEELATESRKKKPQDEKGSLPFHASRMKLTLGKYYARRKKEHQADYPDFFDEDLRKIFNGEETLSLRENGAARFLQKHRKEILESVSYWTAERKFPIERLIKRFHQRCETLQLRVGRTHADTLLQLSAYLATLVTHYLFTGKFKRRV